MWKKYCFNWSSFSCCFSFFASFLFAIFFNSFSIGIWKMRKANGEEKAKARVKWGKKNWSRDKQAQQLISIKRWTQIHNGENSNNGIIFDCILSISSRISRLFSRSESSKRRKKKSLFDMKTRRTEKSAFEVQKTRRTDNQTRKFNKVKYDCDSIDSMRIDDNGQCQIGRLQKGKWKEHEETANKIAWAKRRTVQRI